MALVHGGFGLALQAEASVRSALAMEMQLLAELKRRWASKPHVADWGFA
jgi:hypothetical protein